MTSLTLNPLAHVYVDEWGVWSSWLRAWKQPKLPYHVRLALAQTGFKARTCNPAEGVARLLLYLNLAEGHRFSSFISREERTRPLGQAYRERRRELATTAFEVLGHYYFCCSDVADKNRPHYQPEVWAQLLHFFRPGRGNSGLENIETPSHATRAFTSLATNQAFNFGLDMCRWGLLSPAWQSQTRNAPAYVRRAHVKLIAILAGLGRLDILVDSDRYHLNALQLRKLEQLARSSHRLPYPPRGAHSTTLEEAAFYGNQAAQVLLLRRQLRSPRSDAKG